MAQTIAYCPQHSTCPPTCLSCATLLTTTLVHPLAHVGHLRSQFFNEWSGFPSYPHKDPARAVVFQQQLYTYACALNHCVNCERPAPMCDHRTRHVRQIDPYRHLIDNSFLGGVPSVFWSHQDFVTWHSYNDPDMAASAFESAVALSKSGKPAFGGEFGFNSHVRGAIVLATTAPKP